MLYLITRDEARHVTFGVNYLEEFVQTLSEEEREDRAMFAYEAAVVMRSRLMAADVYSCLLYTSPSPRDNPASRMPSSA